MNRLCWMRILIHRMDPKSSYMLKIKLSKNPKMRRKKFTCFHVTNDIGFD